MKMNKIGILCPMDNEVETIADAFTGTQKLNRSGVRLYEGRWHEQDCVVMKSGLGKVAAAAGAQHLISAFGVNEIIVSGCSGALVPHLKIADLVIAERLLQHDLDVRPLFDYAVIPDLGLKWITTDHKMRNTAIDAANRVIDRQIESVLGKHVTKKFGITQSTVYSGAY